MADVARQQLDADIRRAQTTRSVLRHLATAIEDAPQRGGETHRTDFVAGLLHADEIVGDRVSNLEHVRAIYDDKVNGGVAAD